MRFLKIAVSILALTISAHAFEQTGVLYGTVERPGLSSLPTQLRNLSVDNSAATISVQNMITGTPKVMTLQYESSLRPTEPVAFSRDFIDHYSTILKNDFDAFKVTANNLILDKFYFINLQQNYKGIDIWGAHLNIKSTQSGKVFMAGGEIFSDVDIDVNPTIDQNQALEIAKSGMEFNPGADKAEFSKLTILPLIYSDRVEYHLCYIYNIKTMESSTNWRAFIDAKSGEIIWREDINRYGAIAGDIMTQIQLATPYDTFTTVPLPNDNIYLENSYAATSDNAGHFRINTNLPGALNIDLYPRGTYFRIVNTLGGEGLINMLASQGDSLQLTWSDENSSIIERDPFYHCQVVHDFIKGLDPDLTVMDFQMQVNINVAGTCNAFYQPWDHSLNFYRDGGGCPNIAQIGDVAYHEWGHGLTDLQYEAGGSGGPNGAMDEGFSDFLACIITNQSLIGRGFTGHGTYLRNIHNTNRYPDDWIGESHNDGLIISGALWNFRLLFPDRPRFVDSLWHYAKYGYGTDFTEYFYDFLAADDDDGNIQNGTPHANQIYYCFGNLHGIGPGINVIIDHNPILDSEDSLDTFTANATVQSLNSMSNGTVVLQYSTGGAFQPVEMANLSGDDWTADIPNQHFGTTVRYYFAATDNMGLSATNPANAPDSLFHFYVGYDTIAPIFQITQVPVNTVDLFGPYGPFEIAANDVQGIDSNSVVLHYQFNSGGELLAPMRKLVQSGSYILDSLITGQQLQTGDTIHYWFTGRDRAFNQNIGRYPSTGALALAMADHELIDNFDTSIANWQVVGTGWVWFDRQGYQSNECMRCNSGDTYSNNMNTLSYRAKAYNLTPYEHIWARFKAKYIIAAGDSCFVVASTNQAGPWTKVGTITGASQWTSKAFELAGFAGPGNDHVYFGFLFTSDAATTNFGALIDNVELALTQNNEVAGELPLPVQTGLSQNYPNPFNMRTEIKFEVAAEQNVAIDVFDVMGRKVVNLVDEKLRAGSYQVKWDGHNSAGLEVASGVYFYKLNVGDKSQIRSMTLIK
jgi:Zn-dependent metalloprotease